MTDIALATSSIRKSVY